MSVMLTSSSPPFIMEAPGLMYGSVLLRTEGSTFPLMTEGSTVPRRGLIFASAA